eukprot:TRINITY_DN59229_c0_g1_i1.p1 TRINITY_DN59229_c0_g1~~TRINITY_DN59229_c0_g1_i1.p1  ORF type:complete len:1567 (+),score=449.89 TRINITY_DN59229_c0_g1_i1:89-4789(+)
MSALPHSATLRGKAEAPPPPLAPATSSEAANRNLAALGGSVRVPSHPLTGGSRQGPSEFSEAPFRRSSTTETLSSEAETLQESFGLGNFAWKTASAQAVAANAAHIAAAAGRPGSTSQQQAQLTVQTTPATAAMPDTSPFSSSGRHLFSSLPPTERSSATGPAVYSYATNGISSPALMVHEEASRSQVVSPRLPTGGSFGTPSSDTTLASADRASGSAVVAAAAAAAVAAVTAASVPGTSVVAPAAPKAAGSVSIPHSLAPSSVSQQQRSSSAGAVLSVRRVGRSAPGQEPVTRIVPPMVSIAPPATSTGLQSPPVGLQSPPQGPPGVHVGPVVPLLREQVVSPRVQQMSFVDSARLQSAPGAMQQQHQTRSGAVYPTLVPSVAALSPGRTPSQVASPVRIVDPGPVSSLSGSHAASSLLCISNSSMSPPSPLPGSKPLLSVDERWPQPLLGASSPADLLRDMTSIVVDERLSEFSKVFEEWIGMMKNVPGSLENFKLLQEVLRSFREGNAASDLNTRLLRAEIEALAGQLRTSRQSLSAQTEHLTRLQASQQALVRECASLGERQNDQSRLMCSLANGENYTTKAQLEEAMQEMRHRMAESLERHDSDVKLRLGEVASLEALLDLKGELASRLEELHTKHREDLCRGMVSESHLSEAHEDLHTKLQDLHRTLAADHREAVGKLTVAMDELHLRQTEEREGAVSDLNRSMDTMRGLMRSERDEALSELSKSLEELRQALSGEREMAVAAIAKFSETLEELQRSVPREQNAALSQLRTSLQDLSQKQDTLRQEVSATRARLDVEKEARAQEQDDLSRLLSSLRSELHGYKASVGEHKEDLKRQQAQLDGRVGDLEALMQAQRGELRREEEARQRGTEETMRLATKAESDVLSVSSRLRDIMEHDLKELRDVDARVKALEERLVSVDTTAGATRASLATLQRRLAAIDELLGESGSRHQNLDGRVAVFAKGHEDVLQRCEQLAQEMRSLRRHGEEASQTLEDMRQGLREVRDVTLAELQQGYHQTKAGLADVTDRVSTFSAKQHESRTSLAQLQGSWASVETTSSDAQEQIRRLADRLVATERTHRDAGLYIKGVADRMAALEEGQGRCGAQCQQLAEGLERLGKAGQEMHTQVETLGRHLAASGGELPNSENVQCLMDRIAASEKTHADAGLYIKSLRDRLVVLEQSHTSHTARVQEYFAEKDKCNKDDMAAVKDLGQEVSKMEQKHTETENQLAGLGRRLTTMDTSNQEAGTQLRSLRDRMAAMEGKHLDAIMHMRAMGERLSMLEKSTKKGPVAGLPETRSACDMSSLHPWLHDPLPQQPPPLAQALSPPLSAREDVHHHRPEGGGSLSISLQPPDAKATTTSSSSGACDLWGGIVAKEEARIQPDSQRQLLPAVSRLDAFRTRLDLDSKATSQPPPSPQGGPSWESIWGKSMSPSSRASEALPSTIAAVSTSPAGLDSRRLRDEAPVLGLKMPLKTSMSPPRSWESPPRTVPLATSRSPQRSWESPKIDASAASVSPPQRSWESSPPKMEPSAVTKSEPLVARSPPPPPKRQSSSELSSSTLAQ